MNRLLETVGFIGLGQMAGGMVKNLLLAGVDLIVYNQLQDVSDKYVQLGARIGYISCHYGCTSQKIFLGLPFTPEVDVALFGPGGIAEGADKGQMI